METEKRENLINENINLQADTLIDLPVADEQADETKGGCPYCLGGPMTNHNETTVTDEEDEGEDQIADLAVKEEKADETKGGSYAWVVSGDKTQSGNPIR